MGKNITYVFYCSSVFKAVFVHALKLNPRAAKLVWSINGSFVVHVAGDVIMTISDSENLWYEDESPNGSIYCVGIWGLARVKVFCQ